MAGNATIGALRVVLGADTAALDKGLKSSQSALADFGKSVTAIAAGIQLQKGIESAVSSLVHGIKSGIEQADKFNKLSQSIGIPVDELSKLKYAADLSDVSLETLSKSTGKLSKAMVDVAGGGTGPAKDAFDALGVSVKNTDGTLKSSSDVLADVADKFAGYKDGAAKTALAIALFGKAGADMIPLLNMGRDGLKDAGDEAQQFGLVLDKNTTQAAENFNDNLARLGRVAEGIVVQLTAKMLPAFEQFSEQLIQAAKDGDTLQQVADGIVIVIKSIATIVVTATESFRAFAAEIKGVFAAAQAFNNWDFAGGFAALTKGEQESQAAAESLKAAIANIWSDAPTEDWSGQLSGIRAMNKEVVLLGGEWGKTAAPIIASGNAMKNALQGYLDSQQKRTASMAAEIATVGKSVGEQAKLRIELEARAIAIAKNIPLTDALNARIAATGDAAAVAAMKLQAAQIAQQVMSPAEKYAQDMAQLQTVYQTTDMTMQTFQERQRQLAEGVGATWEQAAAQGASGFDALANQFGKSSKEMAIAGKAFGIIEATINTYTAFTKALAGSPPPFNYVMAAGVLAAGMAKVAAIKSQSIPGGMMTGGSMMVRGGGGPDSTPVSFMASPGEQIDVWRPDQGGGGDPRRGGGGAATVVNLSMPIATTRDAFRAVIDGLNDMMRDGYRLNVVPA